MRKYLFRWGFALFIFGVIALGIMGYFFTYGNGKDYPLMARHFLHILFFFACFIVGAYFISDNKPEEKD